MWTVLPSIFYQQGQKLLNKQAPVPKWDICKKWVEDENEYMPSNGFQPANLHNLCGGSRWDMEFNPF